jgi:transglutaminase-like putative cysteine protease
MTVLVLLAYLPLLDDLAAQVSAYVLFLCLVSLAAQRWPLIAPGRWLLLALTLAGGLNVYHAYHTFAGQEGGTALLATMLALKLLETRRLRDLRVATVLYGFLLIGQFLFDQSPWLALYLGALLVADFALMADLNARVARSPVLSALRTAASLTLQALPLALVLFVLFPRLSAPLWSLGQVQEEARSGIKDWLEPGSISELVIDGQLAFRVRFDGTVPNPDGLYWRGPVLWSTDGRRWLPAERGRLPPPQPLARAEERIAYSITPEPSGQRWLFALDLPVESGTGARIAGDHQVLTDRRIEDGRSYRLVSALSYDTGELDLAHEVAGLELPENITPRMRRLVDTWTRGAQGPEDVIREALAFFNREPFHYTLLPPRLGDNPADEFLFETRRGFCEHYASSFALLMRVAGIPARIVLGYLGGEVNPIGGYLILRQSDAHAWVEVWLAGKGWTRVDPTAAIASARVERRGLLEGLASGMPVRLRLEDAGVFPRLVHGLRLLADSLDAGWRDWVLGLSRERQQRMLDLAGLGYLREYGLAIAMVTASAAVLAMLLTALLRGDRRQEPLDRIYGSFCRKLAGVGFRRLPREGPVAFADRVSAVRPDLRGEIDEFLALYLPLRYGSAGGSDETKELRRRVARFRPSRG